MYPRLSFLLRLIAGLVIIFHEAFGPDPAQPTLVTAALAMIFGTSAVEALIRRWTGGGDNRE